MKVSRTNVDVAGVLHAGHTIELREALALPDFASYRFPDPVVAELTLRRAGGGLEARGSLCGTAEACCARCLETTYVPLDLLLDERFEPAGAADPFAESNVLHGAELDILDLVRQAIGSALPMVVLCSDECPGLCSTCGQRGGCGHQSE